VHAVGTSAAPVELSPSSVERRMRHSAACRLVSRETFQEHLRDWLYNDPSHGGGGSANIGEKRTCALGSDIEAATAHPVVDLSALLQM